MYLIINEITIS